jgi:hypothetical protein
MPMTPLRSLAIAATLAAGALAAGPAAAAPASAGKITPPAAHGGLAAEPVYHWRRHCWPVYRWVWTHRGWRHRYVGMRCRPRYRHYW